MIKLEEGVYVNPVQIAAFGKDWLTLSAGHTIRITEKDHELLKKHLFEIKADFGKWRPL